MCVSNVLPNVCCLAFYNWDRVTDSHFSDGSAKWDDAMVDAKIATWHFLIAHYGHHKSRRGGILIVVTFRVAYFVAQDAAALRFWHDQCLWRERYRDIRPMTISSPEMIRGRIKKFWAIISFVSLFPGSPGRCLMSTENLRAAANLSGNEKTALNANLLVYLGYSCSSFI